MADPNKTITLTSQTGETLDCMLFRANRKDNRDTVLADNPFLTNLPAVLPTDTAITLPIITSTPTTQTIPSINLWD